MTVVVKHGPAARERDEHVNRKAVGNFQKRGLKPTFPVRFCSFVCSQTRHVGSIFDEDRNMISPNAEESSVIIVSASSRRVLVHSFELHARLVEGPHLTRGRVLSSCSLNFCSTSWRKPSDWQSSSSFLNAPRICVLAVAHIVSIRCACGEAGDGNALVCSPCSANPVRAPLWPCTGLCRSRGWRR
jgi:hypothetical protein